jgi:hypothetical protein
MAPSNNHAKLQKRYDRAQQKLLSILEKYGSLESLTAMRTTYKSNNNPSDDEKAANRDYLKYYRNRKLMSKLAKELGLDEGSLNLVMGNQVSTTLATDTATGNRSSMARGNECTHHEMNQRTSSENVDGSIQREENEVHEATTDFQRRIGSNGNHKCNNCFRRQSIDLINEFGLIYEITFFFTTSDQIRSRNLFRYVQKSNQDVVQYCLCSECADYLLGENNKEAQKMKNTWPSFVWSTLQNLNVRSKYNSKIWQFIPKPWRFWWLDSLREKYPIDYGHVSLEKPEPIFEDKTNELSEWNNDFNSLDLPKIAGACNKACFLPRILCPWGCSEFNHRCGYLDFDIVWQRYLPKCIIKTINDSSKLNKILNGRNDYIRTTLKYDCWLLNPGWDVKPSIIIEAGVGPQILTCSDHNGGCNKFTIHPCLQPDHILPSAHSDQLCHAVIKSRTIKPMKASKYSNTFQMNEQRGSFNGIDTCSITNYGRFDFCSKLQHENECRSIGNRPDINALLTQLCKEKVMSKFVANIKRDDAELYCRDINFDVFTEGGTYVPIEAAMTMQRDIDEKDTTFIWDNRGDDLPIIETYGKKLWPSLLFPLQQNYRFGVTFSTIPYIRSNTQDTSFVWILAGLLTRVQKVWSIIYKCEMRQSRWHGWMLAWLSS